MCCSSSPTWESLTRSWLKEVFYQSSDDELVAWGSFCLDLSWIDFGVSWFLLHLQPRSRGEAVSISSAFSEPPSGHTWPKGDSEFLDQRISISSASHHWGSLRGLARSSRVVESHFQQHFLHPLSGWEKGFTRLNLAFGVSEYLVKNTSSRFWRCGIMPLESTKFQSFSFLARYSPLKLPALVVPLLSGFRTHAVEPTAGVNLRISCADEWSDQKSRSVPGGRSSA